MLLHDCSSALHMTSYNWSFTCRSFPSHLPLSAAEHLREKESSILAHVLSLQRLPPASLFSAQKGKSNCCLQKEKRPKSYFLLEQQNSLTPSKSKLTSLHFEITLEDDVQCCGTTAKGRVSLSTLPP